VHTTAAAAHPEWQHLCQRDPRVCGVEQTRWTLAGIRQAGAWLGDLTLAGVHTVLRRARIGWKRARASIRSPDPDYEAKLADVEAAVAAAKAQPGRVVTVYLDEVTVERQPTVANAYAPTGSSEPARAVRSPKSNTVTRILGALNALTGGVFYRRASKITVSFLVAFYQARCLAHPDAERIDVIQDHWPVHTHPDLLAALEPQETRSPWYRPPNWPTEPSDAAIRRWGPLKLPIPIVPLPTYASWCHPIEKVWRKLRQDVTHLHRWADDLDALRTEIDRFLDQFAHGSLELLRYVGLAVPD
jgi:DDE superfamily endonuclease